MFFGVQLWPLRRLSRWCFMSFGKRLRVLLMLVLVAAVLVSLWGEIPALLALGVDRYGVIRQRSPPDKAAYITTES